MKRFTIFFAVVLASTAVANEPEFETRIANLSPDSIKITATGHFYLSTKELEIMKCNEFSYWFGTLANIVESETKTNVIEKAIKACFSYNKIPIFLEKGWSYDELKPVLYEDKIIMLAKVYYLFSCRRKQVRGK